VNSYIPASIKYSSKIIWPIKTVSCKVNVEK